MMVEIRHFGEFLRRKAAEGVRVLASYGKLV